MLTPAQKRAKQAYNKRHPEIVAYSRARNMAMRFVEPVGKLSEAVAAIDHDKRKNDLLELQAKVSKALKSLD